MSYLTVGNANRGNVRLVFGHMSVMLHFGHALGQQFFLIVDTKKIWYYSFEITFFVTLLFELTIFEVFSLQILFDHQSLLIKYFSTYIF